MKRITLFTMLFTLLSCRLLFAPQIILSNNKYLVFDVEIQFSA